MNKQKRISLREAKKLLDKVISIVSIVLDDEQDCLEGVPENLQSSERCEKFEKAVENLEECIDHLENAREYIENTEEI